MNCSHLEDPRVIRASKQAASRLDPEDEGCTFLRNFGKLLPDYTASLSLQQVPQISDIEWSFLQGRRDSTETNGLQEWNILAYSLSFLSLY
jgi:hypothetical protein